jgi:prepilin signal peptidase PulO-like enzyme (type II secretory pathway)
VRIPAEHDDRIMNILISRRVGPIGFSPVAEAYRNFGDAGPFLVMMLVGIILALLDRRPRTAESQLAVAVVMIPLLINVRNSFVPIPAQLVMGAALLLLLLVLRRVSTASAPAGPSFRLPPPT